MSVCMKHPLTISNPHSRSKQAVQGYCFRRRRQITVGLCIRKMRHVLFSDTAFCHTFAMSGPARRLLGYKPSLSSLRGFEMRNASREDTVFQLARGE